MKGTKKFANRTNDPADLGVIFGIKPKQPKPEKQRKCNQCGGKLIHVPGTNVYICENEHEDKKGNKRQHYVLSAKSARVPS